MRLLHRKTNIVRSGFLAAIVFLAATACRVDKSPDSTSGPHRPDVGPLNATYTIEGSSFTLRDGRVEMPAAPGSAAQITLTVFDTPVYGELDDDQERDAAVVLVYQSGGSGTFYYLAAAIQSEGRYRGTNALLLGDRVVPQFVRISDRTIVAGFRDRGPSEPFSSAPTLEVIRYAVLDGQILIPVPAESEQPGWVTYGHEVRAFMPCSKKTEHWLLGRSPALPEIATKYAETMSQAPPYVPLYMVLSGSFMDAPRDGFGADYDAGFLATKLIDVRPAGNCREEFVSIEAPAPGTLIESPLVIKGRARGTWFFEGDFPVVLEDADGNALARSFVTAEGEWMTQEFVHFTGTLSFTTPDQGVRGTLIFTKDNPTDRPELDDSTAIPVFFVIELPGEDLVGSKSKKEL